jgi:hypothetical protein
LHANKPKQPEGSGGTVGTHLDRVLTIN